MKKLNLPQISFFAIIGLLLCFQAFAQEKKMASPPAQASGEINGAQITIDYHSPSVRERTIWGELVPFGKVWRAGANNATTFETDKDIKVEGAPLPAGKYSFFIIPGEKESVFIFNSVAKQWGAYDYDENQDVLRITVPSHSSETMQEQLEYQIVEDGFEIRWEYGKAKAHIE